jgi:L-amino acid N-acyltransferase YncA
MAAPPTPWTIRPATSEDFGALAAIYDHEARTGWATFDTEPQGTASFAATLAAGNPLLVGTEAGRILGYAYAGPFRTRPAYDGTRETTVYLHRDGQGRGLGSALYAELLAGLDRDGIHRCLAVIALPNPGSIALHRRFGFTEAGVLTEVGRKFDRWIDVALYERRA